VSIIFHKLENAKDDFIRIIRDNGGTERDEGHDFPWPNYIFQSNNFRRAHLDIVDARETKKLYMMHLCIFPNTCSNSPIYGFDIIAGPNKVTGAFHDFSPTTNKNHDLCNFFEASVSDLSWSKKRNLPDWAMNIFSKDMVAAGNISEPEELDSIIELATNNLSTYLLNVGNDKDSNSIDAQNYYCENQRMNPHTPKVMEALGFDAQTVEKFIKECLFPTL
jgi:hypothetical protein